MIINIDKIILSKGAESLKSYYSDLRHLVVLKAKLLNIFDQKKVCDNKRVCTNLQIDGKTH